VKYKIRTVLNNGPVLWSCFLASQCTCSPAQAVLISSHLIFSSTPHLDQIIVQLVVDIFTAGELLMVNPPMGWLVHTYLSSIYLLNPSLLCYTLQRLLLSYYHSTRWLACVYLPIYLSPLFDSLVHQVYSSCPSSVNLAPFHFPATKKVSVLYCTGRSTFFKFVQKRNKQQAEDNNSNAIKMAE